MADDRLPIPRGEPGSDMGKIHDFLAKGHDEDGEPMLGSPRSVVIDKTIGAGRSLVVSGYFRIEEGVTLRIGEGAELAIV